MDLHKQAAQALKNELIRKKRLHDENLNWKYIKQDCGSHEM